MSNAEQIEFWNGRTGARWSQWQRQIDQLMKPFTTATIECLAPRPGERIVDVGCGAGETSLAIADRVQAHGFVLGLDVSRPLLRIAQARAAITPEYPVQFVEADASSYALARGAFDALFSRFGVMFFADPAAAFAHLARGLATGGRLAFCCWRDRRENAWVRLSVEATRRHLRELPAPPGPDEPGPFSFADEARIRRILDTAGFRDVRVERFDPALVFGADEASAAEFLTRIGPTGSVLQEHPETLRGGVAADLAKVLGEYREPGGVTLGAAAWLVTARLPAHQH
jgi:SAM-dependent methyltransferase